MSSDNEVARMNSLVVAFVDEAVDDDVLVGGVMAGFECLFPGGRSMKSL